LFTACLLPVTDLYNLNEAGMGRGLWSSLGGGGGAGLLGSSSLGGGHGGMRDGYLTRVSSNRAV